MPKPNAHTISANLRVHQFNLLCAVILALLLGGCGGGSANSDGGSSSSTTGTLAVSLADATTDAYAAVYVTIDRVEVLSASATDDAKWESVATTRTTTNLLELVNGVRQHLGETDLKEGAYSQMRLILGTEPASGVNILDEPHPFAHYTITSDAHTITQLRVPSGLSSGIKLISPFGISADETTDIVIDFDASRSIVETGSAAHLLKPVLKTFEPKAGATLTGTIAQSNTQESLEGCYISAQKPIQAEDGEEFISPDAGTLSSTRGQYSLQLDPGEAYLLLAYKHGYEARCFGIESPDADTVDTQNFVLDELLTPTGVVSGQVSVSGQDPDSRYATIQVRRNLQCQNENGTAQTHAVIVKSVKIANNSHYRLELPPAQYRIIAYAPEQAEIPLFSRQINLNAGAALTEHINLR